MTEIIERVTTLEAKQAMMDVNQGRVLGYLEANNRQNIEVTGTLAVIKDNLKDLKENVKDNVADLKSTAEKYEQECMNDRTELFRRLGNMDSYQKGAAKSATIIATVLSTMIATFIAAATLYVTLKSSGKI